jgi:uncharacterized coiled-coil DUF342 family protein
MRIGLLVAALCADAAQLRLARAPSHSPVTKVILLISRVQTNIENEGKEEAKAYDKYACFCKEQADGKQYAIDKANELEESLTAKIDAATSEKERLQGEISTLDGEITGIEDEMDTANTTRKDEHASYLERKAELEEGIQGAKDAINETEHANAAIEEAKATAAAALSLQQLAQSLQKSMEEPLPDKATSLANDIVVASSKDPPDLLTIFKSLKKHLEMMFIDNDKEELATQQKFEMLIGAHKNQIKAKEHAIKKFNATCAELTEEIATKTQDRTDSETARTADENFLADLTDKCQKKSVAWDARSKVRSGELEAISKALEILKARAVDVSGSTDEVGSKLGVGLLAKGRKTKARAVAMPPALVQVGARERHQGSRRERAIAALKTVESSRVLAILKSAQTGSLDEVSSMVQGLIDDLDQEGRDADAEAQWCVEEMTKATEAREETKRQLDELNTTIVTTSNERDDLAVEIAGLGSEISALSKGLSEETTLHNETMVHLEKVIADATIGEQAVADAIDVLRTYYGGVAVTDPQVEEASESPVDSEGNSVSSMEPETFGNEQYGGSQDTASHILGLLEEVKSDFTDTISDSNSASTQEDSDYDQFKTDTENDIKAKGDTKTDREDEKTTAVLTIAEKERDENTAEELLAAQEETIERLKPGCSASQMAAADRARQRDMEKSALQQALDILSTTTFDSTANEETDYTENELAAPSS